MIVVFHDNDDAYEREYQRVRAAFVAQGRTLQAWLDQHGVDRQLAYRALKGKSFGRKAVELRARLLREADTLARSA